MLMARKANLIVLTVATMGLLLRSTTDGFVQPIPRKILIPRLVTPEKLRLKSVPLFRPPSNEGTRYTSSLWQTALEAQVPPPETATMIKLRKYAATFCNLFPVWTVITAAIALTRPSTFLGIPPSTFPAQIGMLMLCMGITLRPSDFKRVAQRPAAVLLAFVGCYGIVSVYCQYHIIPTINRHLQY